MNPIMIPILWHDAKTDPPEISGQYAVVFHTSLCCPWERHTYESGEWRNERGRVVERGDPYYPVMWADIITPDEWE